MVNKRNKRAPAPKAKQPSKSKALKGGWQEQWRYALRGTLSDMWRQPLATLLTVMVIAISLTLPSVCYMVWKNVSQAATQWYPAPQLTVYLDKALDDTAAENVTAQLKQLDGVDNVNYLTREEALNEFRNCQVLVARWTCWSRIRCRRWLSSRQNSTSRIRTPWRICAIG